MKLFSGVKAIFKAFVILGSHRKLWGYCLLPSLAALGLSIVGVWAGLEWGQRAIMALWSEPTPGVLHSVWRILTGLVQGFSALLTLVITPYLVMLVGLPLCEPLSFAVDRELGLEETQLSLWSSIKDSILSAFKLTSVALIGSTLLFILGFVPALGTFTTLFAILIWTPGFLAFDLVDSPLARRGLVFPEKVNTMKTRPLGLLSLGWMGNLLVALPVVNLIGLPIAVIAGVCWVRDKVDQR